MLGVEEQEEDGRLLSGGSVNLHHTVGTVDSRGEKQQAQAERREEEGVRGFAAPDLTGGLLAAELPYRRSCLPLPHRVCQGRKSQQFLQPSEEKRNATKSPKGKGRAGAAEPQKLQGKAKKATGQRFPRPVPSSDASRRS